MVVLYCLFVSGVKQPWANGDPHRRDENTVSDQQTDIADEAKEKEKEKDGDRGKGEVWPKCLAIFDV